MAKATKAAPSLNSRSAGFFGTYSAILCLAIWAISCARGQEPQEARFESAPKEEAIPAAPSLLYRDEGYFWAQTKENNVRVEQYDEAVDPIQQGMRNERQYRQRGDVAEDNAETNWSEDSVSETQFEARHESVLDREMPEVGAGGGRMCGRGKVCAQREESRALMIENVKRNILSQLRMREPPNITVPKISLESPPIKRILKKYGIKPHREQPVEEVFEDEEWVEDETAKEKVISYAREPPYPGQSGSYFTFAEEDMVHTVTAADIWLYIRPSPTFSPLRVTLDLYRYQENTTHPDAPPVAVRFTRKVIQVGRKGHWRSFSIAAEVSRWFIDPDTNLGIDIRCPLYPDLVAFQPTAGRDDKKPIVEVDLAKNEYSRRRKRDLGNLRCTEESGETRCCKYDFQIDFNNMGWNWIINPSTYRSFYCSGDCPFMFLQSNQNKVIAMQSETPKAAAPCCAPTKMSSISMLYFDSQENIVYSEVPDMVVDRCGCM